jgi:4-hydroxybenzoate polyprenyltransferase
VGVFAVCAWTVSGHIAPAVAVGAAASFVHTLAVSVVARVENARPRAFGFPVVPAFIAAMSLTDGVVLAIAVHPAWLAAGALAAALTWLGQRFVRGD